MIESKGYKITPIDGDLAVSRNAEIGRDVDIHGKARVAGSLKVEGFLDAPNIKGVVKGLFVTEEELKREYPNPRPGYCAIVLADGGKGFLYIAKNREWEKQSEEAQPFDFIVDSINVFASKGELADETARAQEAERILAQGIVNERTRAEAEENKIKQQAAKYDRIGFNESADKIELYAGSIDGSVHYADISSATHEKAGVMTAMDKTNLDNSTVKSITWNNDTDPSNMNDFVVAGVYDIKGEHTREDDNLPIINTGSGHTFNARLTVLDSSIPGSGEDDDKCITQVLSFSNRLGQGEVYIRTGKGASLDNLTWEKWSTLQRNVNVGEVGSLDDLKENGIYSGVWKQGRIDPNYLAFVCIVINDYFIGTAPIRISQFVYGLSKLDGSVVYQSRVWDDSKGMWGDWEILNQKEISSMIDNAIKGIIADAPEAFDTLKEIANWIDTHGSEVTSILMAIEGLSDELNREADTRMLADNDTRSKGVLFGGFSNRQTTANEVAIGYKSIDQEHEGAFSIPAATTEKAGVMSAADKKKLDSLSPGGGGGGVAELMEEVTYSELVALRDNANLVAGMKYRITDYVTTTVQQNTKSANHQFDVIVEAVSENELSELAQAIRHEGDTYFDGNDLGAWQLWYDLDNNTDKYAWADVENGKGVIYRMIDEKKNDCPYDFKNILFYASSYGGANVTYDRYYHTFSYVIGSTCDGTVDKRITHCHNNSMGAYTASGKSRLNNNVFIVKKSSYCIHNTFGTDCCHNTFEEGCYLNTFGTNCCYNIFRSRCYSNTFNDHCEYNMFGNGCNYNTFGAYCEYNTFGDNCGHNTFGNYCRRNEFENTSNRKLDNDHTSITLNEEYYDDGTNALVPIKHPDLSTQPSILPYKFMGQYVYEQLIPTSEILIGDGVSYLPTSLIGGDFILDCCAIGTYGVLPIYLDFFTLSSTQERVCGLYHDRVDGNGFKHFNYIKIVYTTMPEEGDYYGYNNY